MRTLQVVWKRTALCWALKRGSWSRRLAGALLLALLLCLAAGVGQARAESALGEGGFLSFKQPNYQGVVAGPVGTRVLVQGGNWRPYATVTLTLTSSRSSCAGVSVGTFSTDLGGQFSAGFLWPKQANHIGAYYACASQANYGSSLTDNAFTLLADSPPSLAFSPSTLVAGQKVTITGKNWLPGPQTVNLVIVPCSAICDAPPVASLNVVTEKNGTFHEEVTISAGAPTGSYYVQAANSTANLSATPAGPIQVAAQTSPSGTPVPGGSPTTTATRTGQDSTGADTTPASQAPAALKVALVAAGLGLMALLAMIGGLAFFSGRSRGPELPTPSRLAKESEPPPAPPGVSRRATWRSANPVAAALHPQRSALALPQGYQGKEEPLEKEELASSEVDAPHVDSEDEYPWEEQIPPPPPEPAPDQGKWSGPVQPPNARAASHTPSGFMPPRRSQRRRPVEDQRL